MLIYREHNDQVDLSSKTDLLNLAFTFSESLMNLLTFGLSVPARLCSISLRSRVFVFCFSFIFCAASGATAQSVSFAGPGTSVNFGQLELTSLDETGQYPFSLNMVVTYQVTASGTLGKPRVYNMGVLSATNQDFFLSGSVNGTTCTDIVVAGNTCQVEVSFIPTNAGLMEGSVQVTDQSGKALATTLLYAYVHGPRPDFYPTTASGISFGIARPGQIAVDGSGNAYVLSYRQEGVEKVPANRGSATLIGMGITAPSALALDGAGDVFIADAASHSIFEVPSSGGPQVKLPFDITGVPNSLAVDAAGDVFVSAAQDEHVYKLAAGGNSQTIIDLGAGVSPLSIAVDYAGNLFVGTATGFDEFPASGGTPVKTLTTLDLAGSNLTLDRLGNVFIVAPAYSNVYEFRPGQPTPIIVANNIIEHPQGIAVDPEGNLYGLSESSVNGGPLDVVLIPRFQPPVLDFGAIAANSVSTRPLKVTNGGDEPQGFEVYANTSNYKLEELSPAACQEFPGRIEMKPFQTCTLTLKFSPVVAGEQDGILELFGGSGYLSRSVTLRGRAPGVIGVPVFSPTPGVYPGPLVVAISGVDAGAKIYYTTDGSVPTASSRLYAGPISIDSNSTFEAISMVGAKSSAISAATYTLSRQIPTAFFNRLSFTHNGQVQYNGSASSDGADLILTNGLPNKAGSAFYASPVPINQFTTNFSFQQTNPLPNVVENYYLNPIEIGDGFTFTIQNSGIRALGGIGDSLGYQGIGKSVAIKFDIHDNAGEGPDSTGVYINGAKPTIPAVDLSKSGIDLRSGDSMFSQVTYDGTILRLTITDTVTLASWTGSFTIDIPSIVGSNTAFIGFTGSTGGKTEFQQISDGWSYASGAPEQPAPAPSISAVPNFANAISAEGLSLNGTATFYGSTLRLTGGLGSLGNQDDYEAGSAYYVKPVRINQFTTDFTFHLSDAVADGFTFVVQNAGVTALGGHGYLLGYASIPKSVAIKFDLHNNDGEGINSTGLFTNGAIPTIPAMDLSGSGIDLHGDRNIAAHITYTGTDLTLKLTDLVTQATYTHSFTIDIPSIVGGNTAYVGFTGATGGFSATQQILNWTFTNP